MREEALGPSEHVRFGRCVGARRRSAVGRNVVIVNVGPNARFRYACGASSRIESVDRIWFRRAPHMEYKCLLGSGVQHMGRGLVYPRRVAKETGSSWVRAVAQDRRFTCESLRIQYTPSAPFGRALAPPLIRPGGLANALGIMRPLSRMVKDVARAETPSLRVCVARYGCPIKYNQHLSNAIVVPVAPKLPSPVSAQPQRTLKADDVVPGHAEAFIPPDYESR